MAQLTKWQCPHIRVTTLEKEMGVTLATFRRYKTDELDEAISIRVPRDKWKWYGIEDAMIRLGLGDLSVIYINI